MPALNVLHIIKSLGRGGAETLLAETIRITDRVRINTHVIYFLPWKNQMVASMQQSGAAVTCFKASNNLLILLQVFRLRRYCREHKIDVVHCHLPWAGFAGRLLFLLARIPVVYTEHNLQERYHFFTRILNRMTFNMQSAVIAVSDDVQKSIDRLIRPAVQVVTILNGVNTERFVRDSARGNTVRKEYSIPESCVVVGTIAVFRFQKRLDAWIGIAQSLHTRYPDVYFVIVGAGPLEQSLKKQVAATSLGSKLIFPGLQTDVIPWLSMIDIYMMTSEFEGLPIALLEAMSMRCSVVATDAGGIKEVIRHRKDGLICGVHELTQLEGFADAMIQDAHLRLALSTSGRERIVNQFSIHETVKQIEQVYLQVTQNQKR